MRRTLSLFISVIMAVSVIFAGTVMSASAESVKYSVDISKLTTNEGKAIVMNGYTDASYATGTYVINFKGVGEACISLGNIDLSKYDTVSMTIGASANAVFDNNGKVAKVAFTSNGAAVTGNKDDGFKSVAGANIIAESNLMPPPGRYGAGEQVVEIALNSSYSGEIFLNYCPSPRDNGGKKTADMIIVSSIVFSKKEDIPLKETEAWTMPEGLELSDELDFEECEDGQLGSEMPVFNNVFKSDRAKVAIAYNDGGNMRLSIPSGDYFDAQFWDAAGDMPYVLSFTTKMTSTMYSFFVRGTEPVERENPAWKTYPIGWYEKDWYNENGGTNGISTTGASGISLQRGNTNKTLSLRVKTYAEDGILISSKTVQIPVPVDVVNELQEYKIYDNGHGTIKYYVAGHLFATVEYKNETSYNDPADDTYYKCYKNVTVKDGYGETVLEAENSRLSTEGVIAIGFRKDANVPGTLLDDVKLYLPYVEPESTPTSEPSEENTEAPATEEADTTPTEEAQTPEATEAPKATDDAGEPAEATQIPSATEVPVKEQKNNSSVFIIVGIAVLAVICAAAIVIVKKKKK